MPGIHQISQKKLAEMQALVEYLLGNALIKQMRCAGLSDVSGRPRALKIQLLTQGSSSIPSRGSAARVSLPMPIIGNRDPSQSSIQTCFPLTPLQISGLPLALSGSTLLQELTALLSKGESWRSRKTKPSSATAHTFWKALTACEVLGSALPAPWPGDHYCPTSHVLTSPFLLLSPATWPHCPVPVLATKPHLPLDHAHADSVYAVHERHIWWSSVTRTKVKSDGEDQTW